VTVAAAELRERGFVVLKGVLGPETVETAIRELERLSGRTRSGFDSRGAGRPAGLLRALSRAWTLPDGVSRQPAFWPITVEARLVSAIGSLLGQGARFLQHTDLHVGFSAVTWHRDSVDRVLGGPDWDEDEEPYRLVRVGFYLQGHAESRFSLGLVPGTHRPGGAEAGQRRIERATGVIAQALRVATGRDPLARAAEWVATEPGDAIVFDPRILHAGSPVAGPKYSLFLAYGVPGRHFARHHHYYRHVRAELGYADLQPELVALLTGAGLYADDALLEAPRESTGGASGFRPSWLRTLAARRIRSAAAEARSPRPRKVMAP
jgi:hypothetical protein